ncbi:uncharacterized protein LOC122394108 isoform X1 [Amphibalanus amphitrite]|uniref:uncharacterized protein LOC122369813 isoform X1 n=3 Tax=Amphibalanus amphitrite TaxID=1232801 RepID=UPI001C912C09|nr:uncharacterized protein LOC122369813 isoform X1 [Amphibalanus amphitrite]XP_043246632.1 uncharacterized protein LOC122394108 isoform X1 [Amphibalanus amphitrite]
MLMQAPDCELADGNITEAPPRHILRQAAHERRVAERHSTNWTEDLAATMAISRAEDLTSKVVKGGIHLIGRAPVVVHLYREHFFRRYHLAPRTLHLDATGSVTRQVGEKRPYLYALIAESPDTDRSFPLAHLLAESHNVPTIAHFLAQVAHGYKLVTRVPLTPPRVVTDFSWALIHAVSEAIVKTTTEAYLEACWQSLTDPTKQPKTLVSLCGAHLLHSFAHTLKSKGVAAEARPGFMWLFASMQQATSLQTLDTTYKRLCVLALSRSKCAVELPEVTRVDYGTDDRQETEAPLEAAEDAPARRTYRARTAFGRHFEDITNGVKCSLQTDGEASDVPNKYFCPGLVEYLLGAVMPLTPLWSQVISAAVVTNAAVESHFKVVKKQMLQGRTRLQPGDFVRVLLKDTAARMKAALIPSRPVLRGRKRKAAEGLFHPETQEECWAKRRTSDKPTWYARTKPPLDLAPETAPAQATKPAPKTAPAPATKSVPERAPSAATAAERGPSVTVPERAPSAATAAERGPSATVPERAPSAATAAERGPSVTVPERAPSAATAAERGPSATVPERAPSAATAAERGPSATVPERASGRAPSAATAGRPKGRAPSAATSGRPKGRPLRTGQPPKRRPWLTAEDIDLFCESISSPQVLALSVYWYGALRTPCRRCTTESMRQFATANTWLLPLNIGNHRVLFVVDWRRQVVLFFDSMGCWPSGAYTEAVQLLMEATQPHLKWTSWRLVVPETPQQTDTWSCGYRVCWLALAAATGSTTPYSSDAEENVLARIQKATKLANAPSACRCAEAQVVGVRPQSLRRLRVATPANLYLAALR